MPRGWQRARRRPSTAFEIVEKRESGHEQLADARVVKIGMLMPDTVHHQAAGALEQAGPFEQLVGGIHCPRSGNLLGVQAVG